MPERDEQTRRQIATVEAVMMMMMMMMMDMVLTYGRSAWCGPLCVCVCVGGVVEVVDGDSCLVLEDVSG